MKTPLRIVGAPGSPYSRKLRAVLRYRRIPSGPRERLDHRRRFDLDVLG